ncbi:RES family NAD+ phosphorylase [Owenweeksia hongkongensis]|uniref:RES family NAD+ phosphorylase n=1 Tax=Owenweeksia hongkongensis TaxID=253245 RepID=UPI001CB920C7|nr:RES domain-containing protein [Owenweeksia hongkongensis]
MKGFITASSKLGDCKICDSEGVHLLAIEELLDFFQELLNNFQKVEKGEPLKTKIQANWNFFISENVTFKILDKVLPQISTSISDAGERVDYIDEIKDNVDYWNALQKELKWSRRYLTDIKYLTEELKWDKLLDSQIELKTNRDLYRARVHHQSGLPAYPFEKMNCPQPNLAKAGRANPLGIPYLYLCNNPKTVLYEVRASYLDEVSIATFNLKENFSPVRIVDFTETPSLYQPDNVAEILKARLLKKKISEDLSKPMRRYDTEIEYIPTQFICEFIRIFTGASGIQFTSSLDPNGINLVMFDQNLMECTQVKLHQVSEINLESVELKDM